MRKKKIYFIIVFLILLVVTIFLIPEFYAWIANNVINISSVMIAGVATFVSIQSYSTAKLQRFETTFFNMLNLHQQITNDLIYNVVTDEENNASGSYMIKGRELFRYLWDTAKLKSFSGEEDIYGFYNNPFEYGIGLKDLLERFGKKQYENQIVITCFDHYFRHLYTIIKFVHNTKFLNPKERYKYSSIVRATLSRYELIWIYYNCLYGAGKKKFKPLIEKYSLLKNMREEFLALSKENKELLINKNKIDFVKQNFSYKDYEFFLTNKDEEDKFNISAFYTKREINVGDELIRSWNLCFSNTPEENETTKNGIFPQKKYKLF